jgi:hypothetical protein
MAVLGFHQIMTKQQHKARHQRLHQELDELVADWITHTGKLPSRATVLDLMQWSAQQTERPTELSLDRVPKSCHQLKNPGSTVS